MTKLKFKIVVEIEYDADPENYPEDKRTPEGMVEVDLKNISDDPYMFIDMEDANWTITGEAQ